MSPRPGDPKRPDSSPLPQNLARQAEAEQRTLSGAEPKVKALLNYLRLNDPIHQAKCFPQLGQVAASVNHMGSSVKHRTNSRSEQASRAARLAQLEALRQELEALPGLEVIQRLHAVFKGYSSKKRCLATSKYEMDVLGFLRLLKDTRLLDNKLTIMQAEAIFCHPRGVKPEDSAPASSHDTYIDFDAFLVKLKRALRTKAPPPPVLTPAAPPPRSSYTGSSSLPAPARKSLSGNYNVMPPPLTEDPEIIFSARAQILPLHRAQSEVKELEVIYTAPILDLLRQHDQQLRAIYAAFAGLDESDPQHTSWEFVRSSGACVGRTEFMLMLLNYQVLPVLLAKHEALEELGKHRSDLLRVPVEGTKKDPVMISYPVFLEALAVVALYIADRARDRILDSLGSPEDMRRLQRYVSCCEGEHHSQLQAALAEASQQWSLKYSRAKEAQMQWLDGSMASDLALGSSGQRFPWLHSCGGDPLLASVKLQAWQREQQAAVSNRLAVMARREDTRMKHALTRLRNSYRDVRSGHQQLHAAAAPPPPDMGQSGGRGGGPRSASAALAAPRAGEAAEARADEDGGPPNPVAFYCGSLQIKTPKPLTASAAQPAPPWAQGPSPLPPPARTSGPGSLPQSQVWSQAQRPLSSDPAAEAAAGCQAAPRERALDALMSLRQHDALHLLSSIVRSGVPPTRDSLLNFVAGYGFVPMPTPKAQLQPIEARDEYELMQQVAERLPALKL